LYESKRVDGKVRHRYIAYLGVYRTERHFYGGTGITYWMDGYWDKACQKLDRLQRPADKRQRIEQKLLERVPRCR